MDEDIFALLAGNEAVALPGVEPLDRAGFPVGHVGCRRGAARLQAQVGGQVQQDGGGHRQQAERGGGQVGNDRQRRQQDQDKEMRLAMLLPMTRLAIRFSIPITGPGSPTVKMAG